jgi:glycosyltransferase involved in cell wall biosynthesis
VTLLSVVIPAYNEERFIGTLLGQIREVPLAAIGVELEIVVVDDCSSDRTAEIAAGAGAIVERHARNAGKGRAVRTGIARTTGDLVMIQDADLEYDPRDYTPMLQAMRAGRGDVVYGSRYLAGPRTRRGPMGKHQRQSWPAFLGGRSLSLVALAFTGVYLTDTVTALKLFRRDLLLELDLQTSGFELDHEITAKVLARGRRIVEVPIGYEPRSRAEGKKIGLRDWFTAIGTYWRFRSPRVRRSRS